jgi:hypothetical protein
MGWLARRDLINDWRGTAIASGAVAGSMFLLVILQALFDGQTSMNYSSFLTGSLVIWGFISASLAFNSLHDKTRNESYLLLPASSVEKVLVRLLSVSVLLPIFIMILITLASVITETVTVLFFQLPFSPLNPFQGRFFRVIGYVVILQSVFFLGAAWFKKLHLIKTVFALILLAIIFGLLGAFSFRILFASFFEGFFTQKAYDFDVEALMQLQYPALMRTLETSGKVVFYGLLAPFCWVVAWLRVKETQSSDGV